MIVDAGLAHRLETTDARHSCACADALQQVSAHLIPMGIQAIGDGTAIYAGQHMPINRLIGLGLSQPITADLLQAAEDFYAQFDAPLLLDFCPIAGEANLLQLRERHYTPIDFYTVLCRDLQGTLPAVPAGLIIEATVDASIWVQTVLDGFTGQPDFDPDDWVHQILQATFYRADSVPYLALIDGEPVGAGSVCLHDGVALLYAASTRPDFRRRGVQRGLMAARLAYARDQGCDLAMVMATPGSDSERNIQRAGFQIAYTKFVFTRP